MNEKREKIMTRQATNQRKYPHIPVLPHVKEAVMAWAKENKYKAYKISDLIEKLPEIAPFIKGENK